MCQPLHIFFIYLCKILKNISIYLLTCPFLYCNYVNIRLILEYRAARMVVKIAWVLVSHTSPSMVYVVMYVTCCGDMFSYISFEVTFSDCELFFHSVFQLLKTLIKKSYFEDSSSFLHLLITHVISSLYELINLDTNFIQIVETITNN